MRRMGGLDAAFLYGETPAWHMHVSAVMVIDPSTAPGGFSIDRLEQLVVDRLPLVPQFRWKLVESPLGLGRPGWVDADDFDPVHHFRRTVCPPPGGPRELGELVGDLVALKLDRRRPLWEMWFIDGLAGDRAAILYKVHHAIIDGVSGAELATVLLDLQPEPNPPPPEVPETPDTRDRPHVVELLGRGIVYSALTPVRAARYAYQLADWGFTVARFLRHPEPPKVPFQAPRTSFNRAITPGRRVAFTEVPLDDVREIKHAFGVKVNDVVLALCAGTLRRYLERRGELPPEPLIAQVPVSLRSADEKSEIGNRVGAMFATLATDIDDPVERLVAIHRSTRHAKEMRRALDARKIMNLTDTTPPGLIALAARTYTSMGLDGRTPPVFNLIISNVPGPPMPLYTGGARVLSLLPMGPLLYGGGLNITVLSYCSAIHFGFLVCREAVPDPWPLAEGIGDALAELREAMHERTARSRRRSRRPARTSSSPARKPKKAAAAPKAPRASSASGTRDPNVATDSTQRSST